MMSLALVLLLAPAAPVEVEVESAKPCSKREAQNHTGAALEQYVQGAGGFEGVSAEALDALLGRKVAKAATSAEQVSEEDVEGKKKYVCKLVFDEKKVASLAAPYQWAGSHFRTQRFLVAALKGKKSPVKVDAVNVMAQLISDRGAEIRAAIPDPKNKKQLKKLAKEKDATIVTAISAYCKEQGKAEGEITVKCSASVRVQNEKGTVLAATNDGAENTAGDPEAAAGSAIRDALSAGLNEFLLKIGKGAAKPKGTEEAVIGEAPTEEAPAEDGGEAEKDTFFAKSWKPSAEDFINRTNDMADRQPGSVRLDDARRAKAPSWLKTGSWKDQGETVFGNKFEIHFAASKTVAKGDASVAEAYATAAKSLVGVGVEKADIYFLDYYVDRRSTVWVLVGGRKNPLGDANQ